MKIRTGFVSNSSSSSYVLVGYRLTEEEAEKVFKENNVDTIDGFYEALEELMRLLQNKLEHDVNYIAGNEIEGALIGLGRDLDECANNEEIDLNMEKEFFNNLNNILFYDNKTVDPTVFSGLRIC